MRVGVIGATGMLGHNTAVALAERGHEIVVIHRPGSDLSRLQEFKFEPRPADIGDAGSLGEALQGLDGTVHAAAYYPTLPRPLADDLALASQQIEAYLSAVQDRGLSRAVYVGGAIAIPRRKDGQPADESGVYPGVPPTRNPYVRCKYLMDRRAREAGATGLPISIAIPSMTFGRFDWGPSTGQIITGILSGRMKKFIGGQRNIIDAEDAGIGIARVLESGEPGQRYLLGGVNTDMETLVTEIARIGGVAPPGRAPLWLARLISAIQAFRYTYLGGRPPLISSTAIAVMSAGQHLDCRRAQTELAVSASSDLRAILEKAMTWHKAHRNP